MLVEAGEQTRQIVKIGAHHVRRAVARHLGNGFFELQQARRQLRFAILSNRQRRIDAVDVDARFTEHGEHAGVSVLHIGRCIALERQHIVPVENVIGGAALRQIGILHRADADHFRQLLQLRFAHLRVLLAHQRQRAIVRLFQQIGELDGAAAAGFERTAVFAQHHAEGVMLQRNGFRHVARFAHDSPRLLQMLMLA